MNNKFTWVWDDFPLRANPASDHAPIGDLHAAYRVPLCAGTAVSIVLAVLLKIIVSADALYPGSADLLPTLNLVANAVGPSVKRGGVVATARPCRDFG